MPRFTSCCLIRNDLSKTKLFIDWNNFMNDTLVRLGLTMYTINYSKAKFASFAMYVIPQPFSSPS